MPTTSGPNTLGESNLVFAYDTGDVKNSYKGQPTVNAFGTYPIDLYGWITTGNACTLSRDTIQSPVGNTPLKMVTTGNDPYTNTYNSTGNNIAAASSGQTWTISVWAKANQNTTGAIFHFGANSSGNYIDFNATGLSLTTEWTRYTYTRTFTDGNVVAIQARLDGPDTFQSGVVVWWDGLQVEQKAYATQFTPGTRSATQGLLPLIGTSTIDLTNVSFDSNAKMVFDGTNDSVSIPTYTFGNGNWTLNMLINANNFNYYNLMSNSSGGPVANTFGAYSNKIYYQNYDGNWQTHSGNTTLSTGTWYMLTWVNYAGAAANLGTMQMFVNGVADSSVFNSYTTNGGPCNVIGANWFPSSFNGRIDITQIYNKSLTSAEIQQNYRQYKTRFNLS